MERRKFIRNSTVFGLGLGLIPHHIWANGFTTEYSIPELMGKASIPLSGDKGGQLRPEAFEAFQKMKKKAYQDGITLKIASGYRSFERQEGIWERKFISYTRDGLEPMDAIEKIIEYSTIPGTSRHHWGTDADIIDSSKPVKGDVLDPQKFEEGGPYADQKKWMDQHAESFGFHLVYTDNPRRRGFKYEPWHYTYAPLSKPMLEQYRSINILAEYKAEYFEGAEYFTGPFLKNYIQDHILDINPDLL
ncbi:M15 family metallopeptidase [Sediminicola luteus]|uniref:D-alanyl-D-alanine carboxypeptidase n=1 Tax=Sediminicola luteus TaxID=319238 RepID=A0A2A4G6Q8_9FLAO|nr:M15 family metallopeptidase [Sediminicola luteus]PCE63435.1 D-alanyl-D-alanine carboxypeptidase [Sediminicola luteus]